MTFQPPKRFFWCSASVAGCPRWSHFLLQLVDILSQGCWGLQQTSSTGRFRTTESDGALFSRVQSRAWSRSAASLCSPGFATGPPLQKFEPGESQVIFQTSPEIWSLILHFGCLVLTNSFIQPYTAFSLFSLLFLHMWSLFLTFFLVTKAVRYSPSATAGKDNLLFTDRIHFVCFSAKLL